MNEFDKAKARAEKRRKPEAPKKFGGDAIVTITVETAEGLMHNHFRIVGYTGSTLPWQRTREELQKRLMTALKQGFGTVRVE